MWWSRKSFAKQALVEHWWKKHTSGQWQKGQAERAARILGAGEALFEAMGVGPQPADQSAADRYVAAVREQLDEATFEAARAEGRAMSQEEAVAYALDENAK